MVPKLAITSFGRIQKQNVVFTQLSQKWFKMVLKDTNTLPSLQKTGFEYHFCLILLKFPMTCC